MQNTFRKELQNVINRHSKDNGSNTPDFILAEYLTDCLDAFNRASTAREKWYGRERKKVDCMSAPQDEPASQPAQFDPGKFDPMRPLRSSATIDPSSGPDFLKGQAFTPRGMQE